MAHVFGVQGFVSSVLTCHFNLCPRTEDNLFFRKRDEDEEQGECSLMSLRICIGGTCGYMWGREVELNLLFLQPSFIRTGLSCCTPMVGYIGMESFRLAWQITTPSITAIISLHYSFSLSALASSSATSSLHQRGPTLVT